ncbi:hypothetical protein [Micromonospora carbonacea]|uniref:Peptidase inhibitor family I36 n=1 Tax=Micromonospora carbonacea TaxID=47853 RepID=A0A7H8XL60_9ACTN|nr:hypothetical protein [Micromonospora carbonacea]MBB5825976.1 hypothetical protein [Micromonospora carbonacea]QLD25564.1 hypothetical protein HXZ27_16225 [Micromonospora carbonacea]
MLWRSIAVAASVAGVLATAPAAAAAPSPVSAQSWGAGNCPQGMLCIWPNWNHPPEGPTSTPSLTTNSEWTGNVPAFNFYNYTAKKAEITWSYTYLGTPLTGTICVVPGSDGDLYVPMYVIKVTWQPRSC